MIVTLDYMAELFRECNRDYFERELPEPIFEILHSIRTCGYFQYQSDWSSIPVISITDAFDFSETILRDIMCHEMIHYYLAYTGADKNCRHGRKFKAMAKELNLNFGLNITKTIDSSHLKRNKHSHFWQSKQRSQAPFQQYNNFHQQSRIRFYKEFDGVTYEFNSVNEYLQFLAGRIVGTIIFIGIIYALLYFFL